MSTATARLACLLTLSVAAGAQETTVDEAELAAELARIEAELEAARRRAEAAAQREAEAQSRVERLETRLAELETGPSGQGMVRALDAYPMAVIANTNLRTGPGLRYDVQVTLPNGTAVTGLGIMGDWVRVRVGDRWQGWIYHGLLDPPPPTGER